MPLPAVSDRLGHAGPHITLSIYSHAIEADTQAAAKLWNDAMADVITETGKRLATNECELKYPKGKKELQMIQTKPAYLGGGGGNRTRVREG